VAISESERRELHAAVEQGIGTRAADLLLAMTEPELPFVLRAEMADLKAELRTEIADLKTELRTEMGQLRSEMAELKIELRTDMGELRVEMAGIRGEIADLRGDLKAQASKFYAANVLSVISVAGLVAGAGAFT
jgi:chromosome segregation ATPase